MSATGIFLDSVDRSVESTGKRPVRNIVSSALMTLVASEMGVALYCTSEGLKGSLVGYPVQIVKSDFIFAVVIDTEYE